MTRHHKHWVVISRAQSLNSSKSPSEYEIIIGMKASNISGQSGLADGQAWLRVLRLELKNSPILHPKLDKTMHSKIRYLFRAFPGIMEWSFEMWEEYFRKDPNPEAEIEHWMAVDRVFCNFAAGKPLERQVEAFRLCMLQSIPMAILDPPENRQALLTDDEVDAILNDYYGYYVEW